MLDGLIIFKSLRRMIYIHWKIAFSKIAFFTKGLKIFKYSFSAFTPWNNMIHMKNNTDIICW